MAGYDPAKAAEYNRLIQQGVNPEAAIVQAGITYEEQGNYEINSIGTEETNRDYGRMSDIAIAQNNTAGFNPASDPSQFPAYDDEGNLQPGFAINDETGDTYYQGFRSQDVTNRPLNPTSDPSQFPAYDDEGNLQPGFAINDETGDTYYRGQGPLTRDVGVRPQSDPSQFPAYDDDGNLQPGFAINDETGDTYYRGFQFQDVTNRPVNPAIDPSQFPAYDDEGNLQPGFAINEETGDTYYRGVGPLTQQTYGFDPNYDEFGAYDEAVARQVQETSAASINDPYYGLTPTQLQDLGGADPTDPYIRARLGIPQLPGSTLFATGGFGTIRTGVPAIDSALGIIGSITSLFSNFASTIGGLFGPRPTASVEAATTGMSVAGLTTPTPTPTTTDTSVNPAIDPSQFPAYDDEGNLQPGFAINDETGGTYYRGFPGEDVTNQPVNPASDPSQFPAYDDEGNLQPGFAINDETGDTYYRGFPGEDVTNQPVNPANDPSQFPAYDDEGNLQPGFAVNDETGGTYYRGFPGEDVTNRPVNPANDPSQFPAYDDNGNLQPGFAVNDETGDTYYRGFPGEDVTNKPVNPASDPSQFPAYDDNGNLQPGFAINQETGDTYYQGVGPATGTNSTTLSAEQADAFYNGTGTLTAAQQAQTNEQTAADAAALYPGTNNTNLKNINEASAAIAQNEAGIANAQNIIAQNNAELADPNISDERRAELEANNAAQENYIALAESNTAENELVIEANADSFAAGGGDPDSGQAPLEVAALEDPGLETPQATLEPDPDATFPEDVDPNADPEIPQAELEPNPDAAFPEEVDPGDDPAVPQAELEPDPDAAFPEDVDPGDDPEIPQAELEPDPDAAFPEDVDPGEDTGLELPPGAEDEQVESEEAFALNPAEDEGLALPPGAEDEQVESEEPFALNPADDEGLPQSGEDEQPESLGSEESFQGAQEAAIRDRAKQQATFQARYKQQGNQDWRVRLSLGPNAQYLYNAGTPKGSAAGILAPLAKTDGVIFPYTPSITTTYSANYEQYDLIHSNYRGIFYKNSRVGDIQVRGTFTAQDSTEANYLLAVIHFFRSATKMFYGQDAERGTPPPICLLNGLGQYQFSDHPVVISSFNYTTPNDVDYIRATNPNNYGANLLNRRSAVASSPGGQSLAGLNRLLNALPGGLPKGAIPQVPSPGMVQQSVSNTAGATYVPTKMEIDITLIPVQTRSQVSKQFSLKGFANGDLLKGGFW